MRCEDAIDSGQERIFSFGTQLLPVQRNGIAEDTAREAAPSQLICNLEYRRLFSPNDREAILSNTFHVLAKASA
jgi:hypothetical protein